MSKVLVDRELLRDCSAELSDWRMSFPDAETGRTDRLVGAIDAILAQPAEAEGVEVVGVIDEADEGCFVELMHDRTFRLGEKLVRQSDHLAALATVTAERDRLDELSESLGRQIADAGKREIAYREERDQLRAEVEALRRQAASEPNLYRAVIHALRRAADGQRFGAAGGEGWAYKFPDAALAAKEGE